jgi:phosphoglycerate dehydrogenase-like enzyme
MKLVYMLTLGHEAMAALAPEFPDVDFVRADSAAALRPHLADVEAVVLVGFAYTAEVAAMLTGEAPRLGWIQSANAGVDSLFKKGVPRGIPLTHGPTIWGPGVAEHAVALLLGLLRGFRNSSEIVPSAPGTAIQWCAA